MLVLDTASARYIGMNMRNGHGDCAPLPEPMSQNEKRRCLQATPLPRLRRRKRLPWQILGEPLDRILNRAEPARGVCRSHHGFGNACKINDHGIAACMQASCAANVRVPLMALWVRSGDVEAVQLTGPQDLPRVAGISTTGAHRYLQ